jgi:glycolate oxidase
LILFNGSEPGSLERAEKLAGEILRLCVRQGGSITGEHGIGMEKRRYLPEMFSETDIDVMRLIRLQIDPLELSNQGKMFPGGEAPALSARGPHPLERAGVISRE